MNALVRIGCGVAALLAVVSPALAARTLTREERIDALRRVEAVSWSHRIWPAENPGPKPPLSEVVPDEALAARVEEMLRGMRALEAVWGRSIGKEEIQAELDRMTRETQAPDVLREMFDALGNDPYLIAETIVRPLLVERKLRDLYGGDDRIHGSLRAQATRARGRAQSLADLERDGADVDRGIGAGTGELGPLVEDQEGFHLGAADGSASWAKVPFESWWSAARSAYPPALDPVDDGYNVAEITGGACPDNTWTAIPGYGVPDGRTEHTAVWTGSEMIVFGGMDGWAVHADGGKYNPATDTWTQLNTVGMAALRYDHTAVWTGTRMIVWGGQAQNQFTGLGNSGGRYDPVSNTWQTMSVTNAPTARYYHTAVWSGTEMIVWGGRGDSTGGRYNPSTDTWTATSTIGAPNGRTNATGIWTGTEMIVWGGGTPATNTGARYNPSTNSWTATSTGLGVPVPRYWHTAVWTGSQMIVWGGRDPSNVFRTGGRYDVATDTWTPTSTGGDAPSPRSGARGVWTGTEMIVFGGNNQGTRLNTGARYNPATSTWTPMRRDTVTATASPRDVHTMVWTGTEALIWGGSFGTVYLGAGSRYAPATDTWALINTTGAPAARIEHTAVWTGTEMIVWGGFNGVFLNTGGRYNPSTDAWTATSIGANVPVARQGHAAVWTGSRMVIWGGQINAGLTATGAQYDPVADAWTPTTALNAPAARNFFGGAWNGQRLLVWGGRDAALTTLGSGGSYDPTADTWTSFTPAPSGQLTHSTIWSGSHMVAWGGLPGGPNPPLNSGWLYEPASGTWTPTSTAPQVPSGRSGHVAVWTGTEMIVWGGASGSTYLSDGGRYCPLQCPTWFRDVDGDGHGTAGVSVVSCVQPGGYVAAGDDCNDADPDFFARPDEIVLLLFAADKITLSWDPGVVTLYDALRGSLAEFPVGSGPSETCLAPMTGTASLQDTQVPLAGQGFWYLVRGRHACLGPYGYRSGPFAEDTSAACP